MPVPDLTPAQRRKHRLGKARLRGKLRRKRARVQKAKDLRSIEKAWAEVYPIEPPR